MMTADRRFLPWLALLVLLAGVFRVVDPELGSRLDSTTLLYVAAAASLLLAREIKSFAFGDYKVEFERTTRIAEEALVTAQDAQASALGPGKGRPAALTGWTPVPGPADDDPWKGVFGGRSEGNLRHLGARVTGSNGWYKVELWVESTDPAKHPLDGQVQFFLHDSFQNDRPIVSVGRDGIARLQLFAYGGFTVGALVDGGATRLELDLAELPGVPKDFQDN